MNQKSKDCGLDEGVECPWIAYSEKCPGESCPGHKSYKKTDSVERYKAFRKISYGRE